VQKTTSVDRDRQKQFIAESKRWLSFFKQSTAALAGGKLKRREQLLTEGLKGARRLKEMQVDWFPDDAALAATADDFLEAATQELGQACWMADPDSSNERCLPYLLEALTLMEPAVEPNYHGLFRVYETLCQVYVVLQQPLQYEDICRKALALKEKQVGQWHPEIVSYLMDLAWALEEQSKYDQSLALKKDALGICQNDKGPSHSEVIALKHGVACTTFLSEGMSEMEAIQKAMTTLTEEERKKFTGGVVAELQNMR
jgi:tetratricopeptide (TPR) repeat protein